MQDTKHCDLTQEELASLRALVPDLFRRRIPEEHEHRLARLGLVLRTVRGLHVTPKGRLLARS